MSATQRVTCLNESASAVLAGPAVRRTECGESLGAADTLGARSGGARRAGNEPAPTGTGRPARLRSAVQQRLTLEHLAAAVLGLLVLAVHDVGYILTQPFWLDEAWVAVTTAYPLSQLPATTSSTPIGWSALLRLVTVRGTESSRLLPLAFAGAAVVIAYWFARELGWRTRTAAVCAGLLGGVGALLVPAMLVRDDLKQYTADACLSLLVLALTSRLERQWSRGRLIALSVAVWGGMLFSQAVTFAGIAAFAALCIVLLARRSWRQLAEACAASAMTAVLMVGVYLVFDARAVGAGLVDGEHMRYYFMPLHSGLYSAITFVTSNVAAVSQFFDLGPVWLAVPLVVAGIITMFRLGRPVTAVAAALLWPVLLAVNAARRYPFLDLRTNTFVFAVTAVVAAIGLIGACTLLQPLLRRFGTIGIVAVAVVGASAFAVNAHPYVRSHLIPDEDVLDQVQYINAHESPSDVILVNTSSSYGFAYYWRGNHPSRRTDHYVAQQYEPFYPRQPRIVVALNGEHAGVSVALEQAVRQAQTRSCVPIWFVRTHTSVSEVAAWDAALGHWGLTAVPAGSDGLSVIRLSSALCRASPAPGPGHG